MSNHFDTDPTREQLAAEEAPEPYQHSIDPELEALLAEEVAYENDALHEALALDDYVYEAPSGLGSINLDHSLVKANPEFERLVLEENLIEAKLKFEELQKNFKQQIELARTALDTARGRLLLFDRCVEEFPHLFYNPDYEAK